MTFRDWLMAWLARTWCGVVHGHADVFHIEAGLVELRCDDCGRRSPGLRVL